MTAAEESRQLFQAFKRCKSEVKLPEWDIAIQGYDMTSRSTHLLTGGDRQCRIHGKTFPASALPNPQRPIHAMDSGIRENQDFRYYVITGLRHHQPAKGVILLIHGLNEKSWEKYLPWARRLNQGTGRPVILFPLAFHMDRAPKSWIEPRSMLRLSRERALRHPSIHAQSLANAAISERLEADPRRFLWSGLQSMEDLLFLCRHIRAGLHRGIAPNPNIDVFAYSIGAFLALIALMANPGNLFAKSRLFCFCGGCVLNRTVPTSRYIMDSEANIALYALYVEHLESEIARNPRLAHYMSPAHPEGMYFRSLLDLHKMSEIREKRLYELRHRIRALVLEQDHVMPPMEVAYTLQGRNRRIPIRIIQRDFKHPYTHENPFPVNSSQGELVNRALDRTFSKACQFLAH